MQSFDYLNLVNVAGLCLILVGVFEMSWPRKYYPPNPCADELVRFTSICAIMLLILGAVMLIIPWSYSRPEPWVLHAAEACFDATVLILTFVITVSMANQCGRATNSTGYEHLFEEVYSEADADSVAVTTFYGLNLFVCLSIFMFSVGQVSICFADGTRRPKVPESSQV